MSKQLKDKAVKIKGKDYVLVSDRILYLSEEIKDYSIETNYDYISEEKMFICKAKLIIGENSYTGLAQEIIGEGYINKTSALENCETSAVGRACAMAGIGVIDSIASVDEINKAQNREKYNNDIPEISYNASTNETTTTEPAPMCNNCGIPKVLSKSNNWYCPNKCWIK